MSILDHGHRQEQQQQPENENTGQQSTPTPPEYWTPPAPDNDAWRAQGSQAENSQAEPTNPSHQHRNRLIALGASAAVLVGGGVAAGVELGSHGKAKTGTERTVGQGNDQTSPAPQPTALSPTSLPTRSQEASTPNASTTPTQSRLEQLATMAPLDNPVIASQPYGSAAVVERLYKNLQYADITGRTDMLEAAIGKANMTSDLGTQYQADVVAIQQHFQSRPADRLTFQYTAKYVEQDSPDSPTYTLIAAEQYAPGQKVESAQKIVLGTEQDPTTGTEHWIISQVLEAVPVPPET